MAKTRDHGSLYDEFAAGPMGTHGERHDEFGSPSAPSNKHGDTRQDEFGKPAEHEPHGPHWDDFPWKAMPTHHGSLFDSDFSQAATAHDGAQGHGTWYDEFPDGTAVRYMHDGFDYEGQVLNRGRDHLIVRPANSKRNGGGRHEVGLSQIKEYSHATVSGQSERARSGAIKDAKPGNTPAPSKASDAHAPSAHNRKARGGGERRQIHVGEGEVLSVTGKSIDETVDVLKQLAAEQE